MNGRTAKLLNSYSTFVFSKVVKGKDIPDFSARFLRRSIKKKTYQRWYEAPWNQRHAMRKRIVGEMRT